MVELQTDFQYRVNHEWGTSTPIERGDRRAMSRVTIHAGGFTGLCRRRLAATTVFVECGGWAVEVSDDRGETIQARWIRENESAMIPPAAWFRLVAPDKPAAALLMLRGIIVGQDFEAVEAGGLLLAGGTRRPRE